MTSIKPERVVTVCRIKLFGEVVPPNSIVRRRSAEWSFCAYNQISSKFADEVPVV